MSKKPRALYKTLSYDDLDDKAMLNIIEEARVGLPYTSFQHVKNQLQFELEEWSNILNMSFRSLQRYKAEERAFDQPKSERIMQIALLTKRGIEIFGDAQKVHSWLETENLALGRTIPKSLLNSTFGISLLMDELTRIEHGILA
jgi:putative toxin-antitoxin system antitoxin component (TIGR02293 family)